MKSNFLICRYCGSKNLSAIGGMLGNPFEKREEKYICLNCGRSINFDMPNIQEENYKRMERPIKKLK